MKIGSIVNMGDFQGVKTKEMNPITHQKIVEKSLKSIETQLAEIIKLLKIKI